ncbi:asparagine synthase C-terminal domain-containing protein [Streptomyces sp.]|uniref:asparagine synthase C-terminal domain-containing protein n=1 Tax=Streptomyces sp. TaxID=1931 RepID=UPI002F3ED241
MTTDRPTALRVAWAPAGDVTAATGWWPAGPPLLAPPTAGIEPVVRFGGGVATAVGDGTVSITWRDPVWPPALREEPITLVVGRGELRLRVPARWRAHAYLGWREGRLLVSSDLRTLATAMGGARPSPEGVAAFLAGGRATAGLAPSLCDNVREVQPGHEVVVDAAGRTRCHRTWTPEREPGFARLAQDRLVPRLRGHLDDLAARILDRHDRVACLFSGGLDSTLTAATLLRRAPERVVLFNVGSGLGTVAEEHLRDRFLRAAGAISHPVDLPPQASLVRSLRDTNAVAALPTASLFAHVFEEIIAVSHAHGCTAIVTGDGGDEAFAEREDLLVDLLARPSRALAAAVGHFALRNGEHGALTARRAWSKLRALRAGASPAPAGDPADVLFGPRLADRVAAARRDTAARAIGLWHDGWTWSGIGSYRRAAEVPEWEPLSSTLPGFAVASPLADPAVVGDALDLARAAMVPGVPGAQPKWLLRQAALDWLAPEVALHPKIGSSDGQISARLRQRELPGLLDLFTSTTARALDLDPTAVESPTAVLWTGDGWVRAAALVAWFDESASAPRPPRAITVRDDRLAPAPRPPAEPAAPGTRLGRSRVALLVALNLAAQLVPAHPVVELGEPTGPARSSSDNDLTRALVDLARRACAVPLVSGSPEVMARALAWWLRLRGGRPSVLRGTAQGRAKAHCWIEISGSMVDVSGMETPLTPRETRRAGS